MERRIKRFTPETQVAVAESRLSFGAEAIHYLLPVVAQRSLARAFPGNQMIQHAFEVTRMRIRHNLPQPSRNPLS